MKTNDPRPEQAPAVDALLRELKNLDQSAYPALHALAENELFRLRGGIADSIDIVSNRQVKVRSKVEIPQSAYPNFNFVGKLLGPGGSTLKSIQDATKTKMAILGSGSLRDDSKEKELLSSGDSKYQHLKQKLHLQVDSLAPPAEAYYRLSYALAELRKVMVPPQDQEATVTPWTAQAPPALPRGAGAVHGFPRGGHAPFRGRGKPWTPRGGVANGAPAMPQPIAQEAYGSNPVAPVYPPMPTYEQPEFTQSYEDFLSNYRQDDTWGKVGLTDARGRGRAHPYSRPGLKSDAQ